MTVEALIELLEEVEGETRDVKFNDGWNNAREIKPSKYNTVNVCLKDGRYTNSFWTGREWAYNVEPILWREIEEVIVPMCKRI